MWIARSKDCCVYAFFSEIAARGGGTLVVEGSHKLVARFLAQHPEGMESQAAIDSLNMQHPYLAELTGITNSMDASVDNRIQKFMDSWHTDADGIRMRVVETTASPGDVILCHPFLYHAASQNHSGIPRFMCNKTTPLKERMNLSQSSAAETSTLEKSIRNSLGY
ncbi:phytanoyl-CoA dioxygenase family protein [Paenibacillus psychroresistens]|nr:phytanoyl-CoA dioxygenase family protein [Paenibacillus psychroresistens]